MAPSRRDFIRTTAAGVAAGLTIPSSFRMENIAGANSRIRVAVIGVNGRGSSLAGTFARQKDTEIAYICDVDERAMGQCIDSVKAITGTPPKGARDFRAILDDKDLDAVVIAMPDHWHAPATILACKAGKHVYVEKPCSHNPAEGELMIRAAAKYNRLVQMGTQRRSWDILTQGMNEMKAGAIGKVYFAKGWYTNGRKSIGFGKEAPVPAWLDYELWQGPAPRRPYRDNLIHYNWHWFWNWGTGEALNNGTHEIDLIRWGLGEEYAMRVNSAGGRYQYKDDWETPDTQVITFDFPGGASAVWEGRSCNRQPVEGRDRGVIFYGDQGSLSTGDNRYTIYDQQGKMVKDVKSDKPVEGRNTISPGEELDAVHVQNFLQALRGNEKLNAPIETGYKSVLLCQLGNIAQRTGHTLHIDTTNGHILNDKDAQALWSREYEKGWEPTV